MRERESEREKERGGVGVSLFSKSGDVLAKRQQVSPPPTMLIKEQTKKHIFTPKEVTHQLRINSEVIKDPPAANNRSAPATVAPPQRSAIKQSPLAKVRSSPVPTPPTSTAGEKGPVSSTTTPTAEEAKISHEETTQRLRNFIKKRTVAEAFSGDKPGNPFQPWAPSISNLRKATSEPNIKVKSRLRAKLNDRPPAFSRSATFSSAFSPRKDIPPSLRERAPSTVEDMVTGGGGIGGGGGGVNYSPPFKFPKLESSFFKSLPNMKNIANMEMAEKAKLISPEDVPMRTLRKEPSIDHSSFTSFYPSLAKLINGGDSMERNAEIWRNQELLKGVRMPEPSMFSPFSHASRSFPQFTNGGGLISTHAERNEAKNVLEYAQTTLAQLQQISQEQEEVKEQHKLLMKQQERIFKEIDALRQKEVMLRKLYYDKSADLAVTDHIVSTMISQSHQAAAAAVAVSPLDFYNSKQAELLLKKHQEQLQAASQAEHLLMLQRSAANAVASAGTPRGVKLNSAFGQYNPGSRAILSQSAPNVQALGEVSMSVSTPGEPRTGLVYDSAMLKHVCTCPNPVIHPESPGRLSSVWARLTETGVVGRCTRLKKRKALDEELELIHSRDHVCRYGGGRGKDSTPDEADDLVILKCGGIGKDDQTVWNETYSPNAARVAAGSIIELACKVAQGELKNGFGLVRPPGHLAERSDARHGCYFNSVAVAAKYLTTQKIASRVLVVDWDLHHGCGLQQAFYNDPKVLVVNIHRHDNGAFFPVLGMPRVEVLVDGKGYILIIPFPGLLKGADFGDPEYLLEIRCVILLVAEQFCPEIVLVSAGFNAMGGSDGYNVTAECFAFMTQELGRLAEGRIVLALEGGSNLVSLSQACEMCARSLLGEPITHLPARSLKCAPNFYAVKAIEECITIHMRENIPDFDELIGERLI
eukprot:sb/3479783/